MSHYVVTMLDFTPILELWKIAKVNEHLFFFSADGNSLLTKKYAFIYLFIYLSIYLSIYLFIYGCVGSSFLCGGFL